MLRGLASAGGKTWNSKRSFSMAIGPRVDFLINSDIHLAHEDTCPEHVLLSACALLCPGEWIWIDRKLSIILSKRFETHSPDA